MLVAQIRRVRKLVPELASVWVREHNLEGGRPACDWDDPADRDRLVSELVDDANELVWAAEDLVAGHGQLPGNGPTGRQPCRPARSNDNQVMRPRNEQRSLVRQLHRPAPWTGERSPLDGGVLENSAVTAHDLGEPAQRRSPCNSTRWCWSGSL